MASSAHTPVPPDPEHEWLKVQEAAWLARDSCNTIRHALESGELRGYQRKKGGRWRIHRNDLDAWMKGGG